MIINMDQKLDHQLTWIIHNEATYSKEEIAAAQIELKRRAHGPTGKDRFRDKFETHWKNLKTLFGID